MSWLILFLAGLFEVVWAVGLKYTEGFTKLTPSLVTLAAMGASFYLLSVALRTLPLGAAYAVWVGIGALGTAIAGIMLFHEAVTPLKLVSLLLVIAGIVGLKLSNVA
ncbi:MAG: quaternary ammonium compound efflux SMR transporter SugE [Nitrosomonas sp.]|nr:quaternary ammonium compound efflux SMR transporter SugE [Nitrosomonas sp.]MCP5252095.1 quaternary ammonium compound efflux SMR transporter SugE [Burkholderiales bacterium]HQU61812.1 quaternary ammonium compound efflux SMR transporter SugE [Nitrosomonas sp.]